MKRAAGIVLVVEINGVKHAVLSKRGPWAWDKQRRGMWENGYQVTAAGGMQEKDEGDYKRCALREFREETGFLIFNTDYLVEMARKTTEEREDVTFVLVFTKKMDLDVVISPATAHLLPVTLEQAETIQDMKAPRHDGSESTKEKPFASQDGLRMFTDENEAVIKALSSY